MTETIISIIQIIIAILLIVVVLVQNQGSGMGAVFGGNNSAYKTKRGADKFLFWTTIVLVIFFLGLALSRFIF